MIKWIKDMSPENEKILDTVVVYEGFILMELPADMEMGYGFTGLLGI